MSKPRLIDIGYQKFGKLTAIEPCGSTKSGTVIWLCNCECGNTTKVIGSNLRSGLTKSCGCAHDDWVESGLKRYQYQKKYPPGVADRRMKYRNYQRSAKNRHLLFELSYDQFELLTSQSCHYCGCEPNAILTKRNKKFNEPCLFNGIDRKSSDKGYTLCNSVTCCSRCNFAKGTMGYQEFLDWLASIYQMHMRKFISQYGDRI